MTIDNKFTGKDCANKVRVLRSAYIPSNSERCLNGCPNNEECPKYIALERTQVRYRDLNLRYWRRE